MTPMTMALFFACVGVLSWAATAAMRRYALSAEILDVPNARSSHSAPTPRGGGVAFVGTFLCCLLVGRFLQSAPSTLGLALAGSGFLVAAIGYWDDRRYVPAHLRFLVHVVAAIWGLWVLNGVSPFPSLALSPVWTWALAGAAVIYLSWMINLFNFMDGIDGIASMEAITVSLGGALVWWLATGTAQWWVPVAFATSVGGFLVWNFPPAKIFMGDAGSGFIGIVLGLLSLWAFQDQPTLLWSWLILLGCFMVDATMTLLRRVIQGEKFYVAHRSHAYQYASRRHGSHRRVTLALGLINVTWLLPLAVLVALGRLEGWMGGLIAYVPLMGLAFHYKAGTRAAQMD
jgi:Fuc2NAc and GlcNAc transferase